MDVPVLPFVSIIIPCRNEEKYMAKCLDSVLEQTYPKERLEILVADGMSTDKTREVLDRYAARHAFIRWFPNPRKIVPTGLNILIKEARGEIIMRMDAHCIYPRDYVAQCTQHLLEYNVDNAGGVWQTLPGTTTRIAKGIAMALTSGFGVGNSLFRTGGIRVPTLVDTVPFGCYRRDVFDRIGLFDEELVRNQDDEFNARLIKSGGKILLVPSIVLTYYARASLDKLWRMYFQYGYFKPLTVRKLGGVVTARQVVPALFVLSLLGLAVAAPFSHFCRGLLILEISAYIFANIIASVISSRRVDLLLVPYLMSCFAIIHAAYGSGYLKGMVDFMIVRQDRNTPIKDMALSR